MMMAKASNEDISKFNDFFIKLEQEIERCDNYEIDEFDLGEWLIKNYKKIDNVWNKVVWGYDILIKNVCNQNKDYLDWKTEIKTLLAKGQKADNVKRSKKPPSKDGYYWIKYRKNDFSKYEWKITFVYEGEFGLVGLIFDGDIPYVQGLEKLKNFVKLWIGPLVEPDDDYDN